MFVNSFNLLSKSSYFEDLLNVSMNSSAMVASNTKQAGNMNIKLKYEAELNKTKKVVKNISFFIKDIILNNNRK